MGFLTFILLLAIAYLLWRITDQMPDLIFRLSEIQRDVAEMRRSVAEQAAPAAGSVSDGGSGTTSGEAGS